MSAHNLSFLSLKDPERAIREAPDFIDILPIAVYACDARGRLRWFNRRAAELWGRSPAIGGDTERFCGSFKLFGLDGTLVRREETPMAEVLRTAEAVHGRETCVERPDGSRITTMVHIDPIKDEAGRLIGAINCFHDTSELHHARSQAAESSAQFRQVLDALPAAVYTTDAAGRVTYYNQAAADLAGREPEIGRDEWCVAWRLYTPDGEFLPRDQCPMATALKQNQAVRGVEALVERPDGTRRPVLPFPTPLRDLSGRLAGAVNMLVDVGERKDAEYQQKLLLGELNHRVKNNMQMLHALLRGAQRETDDSHAKAVLAEAGQRVGAMAAAQQVLYEAANPTHFSVGDFMRTLCRNAAHTFAPRVSIALDTVEGRLPNDAAMPLALVLNELVGHSLKRATGEGRLSLAVSLARQDGQLALSLADDLPPAEAVTSRASGPGLVNGLAAQLGGVFRVERGERTRYIVEFPAPHGE
ncbi:MAG TPA: PAS domain-containing protein [Rhizomicrobium sp.]|nr:PAS domain-containing protein [Rhizomicrobium sp.]